MFAEVERAGVCCCCNAGETMNVFDELFLKNSIHINALPSSDDLAKRGKLVGDTITTMVNMLRSPHITPHRKINALAALEWDLIGNNMTPTALADVPQVHFGASVTNEGKKAVILCPMDFYERVSEDFVFCAGALVFVGSQARDWYNDKLCWFDTDGRLVDGREEVSKRARAYEAEWLLFIQGLNIGYEFNEYQQKVLEYSPEGLDSHPELIYDSKPFVVGEPTINVPPEYNPWEE